MKSAPVRSMLERVSVQKRTVGAQSIKIRSFRLMRTKSQLNSIKMIDMHAQLVDLTYKLRPIDSEEAILYCDFVYTKNPSGRNEAYMLN